MLGRCWAMAAYITWVIVHAAPDRWPLANLYHLVIIASAAALGPRATLLNLALIAAALALIWSATPTAVSMGPELGLILGPMAEAQLRRALQLSQGDLSALFLSPFAAICYIALILIIALGLWLRRRQSRLERTLAAAAAADTSLSAAVNQAWDPGSRPSDVKTSDIRVQPPVEQPGKRKNPRN